MASDKKNRYTTGTPDREPFEEVLPKKYKFGFSMASMANGILSGMGFSAITFFYTDILKIRPDLAGLVWLIFGIWNAINDPLFGIIEDRTKSGLGRRVPYLRYGAPFYVLAFVLCWYPFTDNSNQIGLFFNMLFVLFALDTMFTMIGLITYALPAEMTFTQKARSNLITWSTLIGVIGIVVSNVLPIFMLTKTITNYELNFVVRPVMVSIGIACGAIIFASSYYIKENRYAIVEESLGFKQSLVETAKNKPFLIFEGAKFCIVIMTTTLVSSITYYVKYVLGLQGGILSMIPIIAVLLVAIVFVLIYNKLMAKYGAKKILLFGLVFGGIAFIITFFIGMEFATALVGFCIIGVTYSATLISPGILFSDTVDNDELRTGKRRETTYAGVEALITKPAVSIANWLFLLIIGAYGYDPNATISVPGPFMLRVGIMIAICIVPAIFLFVAAAIIKFYPLDTPEWKANKEKLKAIHEQKEREFIEKLRKEGKI
ncbi:MAG: MFS transporter [Candidatus Sigynarchaeota archaeon]